MSLVEDNNEIYYNIEMQNGRITEKTYRRFQFYLFRVCVEKVYAGDKEYHLGKAHCIVFCNDNGDYDRLISHAQICFEDGPMKGNAFFLHQVNLNYLEKLKKKKELKDFTQFEIIAYVLKYGFDNDILQMNIEVINKMKNIFDDFFDEQNDNNIFAFNQELYRIEMEEREKERLDQEEEFKREKEAFSKQEEALSKKEEAFSKKEEAFSKKEEEFTQKEEAFTQKEEAFTQKEEAFAQKKEAFSKKEKEFTQKKEELALERDLHRKTVEEKNRWKDSFDSALEYIMKMNNCSREQALSLFR